MENETKDFENQNKWGEVMSTQDHLNTYKSFLRVCVAVVAVSVLVLVFMAAFLT